MPYYPPDFCKDKSEPMLYEARLKEWRDNKSRIDGAWTDGVPLAEAKKKLRLE
jgi:hypothetical protein